MKKRRWILAVFLITLFPLMVILKNRKTSQLEQNGVTTSVKIIRIIDKSKGITTREIIAEIEFSTVDGKIKKTAPFQSEMVVGSCYEIVYSANDYNVFNINSSKLTDCDEEK